MKEHLSYQQDSFASRLQRASIAEILLNVANPRSLEERIHNVEPGKNPLNRLSKNEKDLIRLVLGTKIQNLQEQRNVFFSILEETYENATHQQIEEIQNEAEHLDYIAEKVLENKKRMQYLRNNERKILEKNMGEVRDVEQQSKLIERMNKYFQGEPESRSFREQNKQTKVNMSMKSFEPRLSSPVFYQHRTKSPRSSGDKVKKEIIKAEREGEPADKAKKNLKDWNANFIVTPYAYNRHPLFSHPNIRETTPDLQTRLSNKIRQDSRVAEISDTKNKYKSKDEPNFQSVYAHLQDFMVQNNANIMNESTTGQDVVNIGLVDLRNFVDYYWGKHSHMRFKTSNRYNKGCVLDGEKITADEAERMNDYGHRVQELLERTPHFQLE